ncbi:unnamed protein product [Sympodiomycopsis kandeliae]
MLFRFIRSPIHLVHPRPSSQPSNISSYPSSALSLAKMFAGNRRSFSLVFAAVAAILVCSSGILAQTPSAAINATSSPSSSSSQSQSQSSPSSSSASSSAPVQQASSNFSLPGGAVTAAWPSGLVLQTSVPYQMEDVDLKDIDLPKFSYHLANESVATRKSLCARQTSFCSTAGCTNPDKSHLSENFCNEDTLATRCTCSKGGESNLQQSNWPVQLADCQNRANACSQACWSPNVSIQDRNSCRNICDKTFRQSCGTPGMVSANYAVDKESQKPSGNLIQGGDASGSLGHLRDMMSTVGLMAVVTITASLIATLT